MFSFGDGYDLRGLHCVKAFRSEEGLSLLEKACTELHARAYPGRAPLVGARLAWRAVYIQQDADAALKRWRARRLQPDPYPIHSDSEDEDGAETPLCVNFDQLASDAELEIKTPEVSRHTKVDV